MMDQRTGPVDVLVVGAGPTGLALAAFGARSVSMISVPCLAASREPSSSSCTLELLRPLGVTPALVEAGDPTARMRLHLDGRDLTVPLCDLSLGDTSYPSSSSSGKRRPRLPWSPISAGRDSE
jgi:2-polyprenyl-6-methoxyphenol hydroxylase-like FAD-dependent oxidoreductase